MGLTINRKLGFGTMRLPLTDPSEDLTETDYPRFPGISRGAFVFMPSSPPKGKGFPGQKKVFMFFSEFYCHPVRELRI